MIRRTKAPSAESTFGLVGGLLALLAAATLALALAPTSAMAVGSYVKLDETTTPSYTSLTVTGEVKADLSQILFAYVEVSEDPNEFPPPVGNAEYVLFPGEEVIHIEKTIPSGPFELTPLKPGTTYYVRIKSEVYGEPIHYSNVVSGTTLPVAAPKVLSVDDASSVSYTTAHVSGEVEGVEGPDPAFESHCRFEYVSDAEFGARDEVQELTVRATGGTFTLSSGGSTTSALAYNASAASVQAALESLSTVGAGNISVSGGPGDENGDNPYAIAFGGTLESEDVEQISVDPGGLEAAGKSGAEVQTSVGGHGVEEFNRASSVPCEPEGTIVSSGAKAVEADLTGLESGTTYHLRLTMENAGGSDSKEAGNFTTLAVTPPSVLGVDDATNVRYTQADVSGEVERPAGADVAFDVNCRFEYVPAEQFISSGFQFASQTPCAQNPVTTTGATPVSAHLEGLTVGTTYYYRLVAANAGGKDVVRGTNPFTTLVPDAPVVSIFPVDEIGSHTAHFSGEINPGDTDPGFNVNWRFQCTPECPGLEGFIPADEADHPISVEATGLKANTEYTVTLIATNAAAEATAGPVAFTTLMAKPVVTTFPAFALAGGTEALVGGTVDPENATSAYWIEWGTDAGYGSSIPVAEDGEAGAGDDPEFVTEKLTGLTPGATYHYRLVAGNGAGSNVGIDHTFTTPAGSLGGAIGANPLPDGRKWEMVSPPDKNRADIWKIYGAASASGNAISYKSQGSFADQPTAKGGTLSDYLSTRHESGWETHGITPAGGIFCFVCGPVEISDEQGVTRFNWREHANESPDPEVELDPEAIGPIYRTYLRNNLTGRFKQIPNGPVSGTSATGDHYLIQTSEDLLGEPPCDSGECVYESLDRGFTWRLASVLPDDSPANGNLIGVSRDGSHVYFGSAGNVYVRIDGSSTTQLPIGPGTSVAGIEKPAGSKALLVSSEQLVAADEDGSTDLYLWDGSAPEGESLTLLSAGNRPGVEAEFGSPLGYNEDQFAAHGLDRGFFTANNQIVEGEPEAGGTKIYSWAIEGGQVKVSYVATANTTDVRVSPDGRFLALVSSDRLTAFDNGGRQEVYRYSRQTKQLVCASCDPEGRPAGGSAELFLITGAEAAFGNGHVLRNVTDDGRLFFQSSEGLVPRDSNGQTDVYEYENGLPYLLSKGTGASQSRFFDAGANGDDVFFVTNDQLVGWDTDHSFDVYDARVSGGLPEPPPNRAGCEGDACQPAPSPPADPTPASENFNGAGNVKPAAHRKHCKKKHCKKHKKKHHKKHGKKKPTRKNG